MIPLKCLILIITILNILYFYKYIQKKNYYTVLDFNKYSNIEILN
jgi:hypothetical protein